MLDSSFSQKGVVLHRTCTCALTSCSKASLVLFSSFCQVVFLPLLSQNEHLPRSSPLTVALMSRWIYKFLYIDLR